MDLRHFGVNQALTFGVIIKSVGVQFTSTKEVANNPRLDRHRERASFAAKLIGAWPKLLRISFNEFHTNGLRIQRCFPKGLN